MKFIQVFLLATIISPYILGEKLIHVASVKEDLTDDLEYFIDETGKVSFSEIKEYYDKFRKSDEPLRTELTDAVVWLRVLIKNDLNEKGDYIVEFEDPSLYSIILYERYQNRVLKSYSGQGISQENKDFVGINNAFKISLNEKEEVELLFKISSKSSMTLSASIMPEDEASGAFFHEYLFLGFYYGIIFIIVVFALFLYNALRSRIFLFYSIYVLSIAAFTSIADGTFNQFLHPVILFFGGYHDIFFFALTNVFSVIFMLEFLKVGSWDRKLFKFSVIYSIAIPLITALSLLFFKSFLLDSVQILGMFTLTLFIYGGIKAVSKNIDQSKFYLAAYGGFSAFILIFILSQFRVIPFSDLVHYSIHIGYSISIIILSLGLSSRVNIFYRELLEKEKEKKQIIESKNQELEEKVEQRTKEIKYNEISLRSILDNSDNSIWLIDKQYNLVEFNKIFSDQWELVFGHKLKRGEHIIDVIPTKELKEKWTNRYDEVLKGKPMQFLDEFEFDGETKYFEVLAFPVKENREVDRVAFFSKDITDRLQSEKQLKAQNQMLKKVNRELDSFVYSASHDLKAPLASVLGLINLVKSEEDMDMRLKYYDMMEKSVVKLDTFIKDIIDYSRNERTEVKLKEISINELIESAIENLKYLNTTDEIKKVVKVEEKRLAICDEFRLKVIITNLLSNAIQYGCTNTASEKKIELSAVVDKELISIQVKDHGNGIEEEHRDKIFEMFYRANENASGTGLGLYIVKETVNKLKGTIKLETAKNQGTRFDVTIPNGVK